MSAITTERKVSLFDIEAGWIPLLEARAEAEEIADPAGRQKAIEDADVALAEHAQRELVKVDGYIGICKFLEHRVAAPARAEAKRQEQRARIAENILRQIKATGLYAMQAAGKKRIDGSTGALVVRANGGVEPLVIADESALPDECCRMEGWINAALWALIKPITDTDTGGQLCFSLRRVPDSAAIRAAIERDGGVPGAHIAERGQHIRIT